MTTRRPSSPISSREIYAKNGLTPADARYGEQDTVSLSAPLEGLSCAETSVDRAARVAPPVSPDSRVLQDQVSLSDQAVALMQARNDFEANLKTLRDSFQMQRTLPDMIG